MFAMNATRIINSIVGMEKCWQDLPEDHKLNIAQIAGIVLLILLFLGITFVLRFNLTSNTNKRIRRAFVGEIPIPEAINLTDSSD